MYNEWITGKEIKTEFTQEMIDDLKNYQGLDVDSISDKNNEEIHKENLKMKREILKKKLNKLKWLKKKEKAELEAQTNDERITRKWRSKQS